MSDVDTVARDQEAAWHGTQRSWMGLLIVYGVLVAFMGLSLVPTVRVVIGNTLLEIGIVCAIIGIVATLGVVLFYRLGIGSVWYQRYDAVETAMVQLCLNGLIFFSHDRVSPAWASGWCTRACPAPPTSRRASSGAWGQCTSGCPSRRGSCTSPRATCRGPRCAC